MEWFNMMLMDEGVGSASGGHVSFFMLNEQQQLQDMSAGLFKQILIFLATRYPRPFLYIYNHFNEFNLLLNTILHASTLITSDASFGEQFYSMKRVSSTPRFQASSSDNSASFQQTPDNHLTWKDRRNALFFLVILPYLKAKLDQVMERFVPANDLIQEFENNEENGDDDDARDDGRSRPNEGNRVAEEDDNDDDNDDQSRGRRPHQRHSEQTTATSTMERFSNLMKKILPIVKANYHLIHLGYQICYMYNLINYSNPILHLLGQEMRSLSRDDATFFEEQEKKWEDQLRKRQLNSESLIGQLGWIIALRTAQLFKSVKYAIPLMFFFTQFLQWWYASPYRKSAAAMKPIPPPPPKLPTAEGGLKKERGMDPEACLICKKTITNPTVTPSGYVFCYPCIFNYLNDHNRCPVTHIPTNTQQLTKLYLTN